MDKLNHNDTPIPLCLLFVIFVHYMCNAANDSLTMHKKYNFLCQITISSFSLWFVTKAVINKVSVKIYDLRNVISIGFLSWCHISASSFGVFYWWAMTILILLVSYDNCDFIGELRQSWFYWWAKTIVILLVSYDNHDFIGELWQSWFLPFIQHFFNFCHTPTQPHLELGLTK